MILISFLSAVKRRKPDANHPPLRYSSARATHGAMKPDMNTRGKAGSKIGGRRRRGRETTRARLLEAALRVMADKGVDGAAINDITETADVGFGTFYNHFESKTQIAAAVAQLQTEKLHRITSEIAKREPDADARVATIQRLFLTRATQDAVWGSFIINATIGVPELWSAFSEQGIHDIRSGTADGHFDNSMPETSMHIIVAALVSTTRRLLEGAAAEQTIVETIVCLLRMLGVPHKHATALARRPLPAFVREMLADESSAG